MQSEFVKGEFKANEEVELFQTGDCDYSVLQNDEHRWVEDLQFVNKYVKIQFNWNNVPQRIMGRGSLTSTSTVQHVIKPFKNLDEPQCLKAGLLKACNAKMHLYLVVKLS